MKSLPSDIKSLWYFDFVVWATYWSQITKILIQKTSDIVLQENSLEIIGIICLDMAKVFFVSKEIEDPV